MDSGFLRKSVRDAALSVDLRGGMRPRGVVQHVGDGVAWIRGLESVGYEELIVFDSGAYGLAHDLGPDGTGAILLSGASGVSAGEGVEAVGRQPALPVGRETLGRIINPLGNPLDDGPSLKRDVIFPLFRPAPEFIERKAVDRPLFTGVMVIDAAIPIGRGQRELIVGDRNVGKTALAQDIVTAQKGGDVTCVYVVIGQPMSRILALRDILEHAGCFSNTVIVAADASMSPGMRYLAPYAGASAAEWFRDEGGDALVIYDDLTKHADAYRELALLLNRPPGREAFPGDIFYIHAELLERAAVRNAAYGGGSVTAFPLVETTDSDISSYIPTNLISITDGQIYLDTTRFEHNQRPAVDVGRSVSRIGSVAQTAALRSASRNLRILISRFEKLESLTRVGLDIDPSTEQAIHRGRTIRELLLQGRFAHRSIAEQVLTLTAVAEGWLDDLEPARSRRVMASAFRRAQTRLPEIVETLDSGVLPKSPWQDAFHKCLEDEKQLEVP